MSKRYQGGILAAGLDPLKAPNAPTSVSASPGNAQATVTFTAPVNVGGSAISQYGVTATPGPIFTTGASSPITVSTLTNGTTYTFSTIATNSYGNSPPSSTATATPLLAIEDVFSTWIYTGNATFTNNIVNGINLSANGGLVWGKTRGDALDHFLNDSARGTDNFLATNSTAAQTFSSGFGPVFNTNGFTDRQGWGATTYIASWTFRKASKFFDVLTYSGTGANRTVSHNLGSIPGCIIVKRTDTGSDWQVYHRSLANTEYMVLNSTAAVATGATRWNSTTPTASVFSVGTDATVNASGGSYVAYLFAHETDSSSLIQCGSYTGNGSSTGPSISLGWEPQWVLIKQSSAAGANWYLYDNIRGMPVGADDYFLRPDLPNIEAGTGSILDPTATGFNITTTSSAFNTNGATYIYLAIRRGPMKTPTVGTSVFEATTYTGTNADNRLVSTGFVTDLFMARIRGSTSSPGFVVGDRLRGNPYLGTAISNAENTDADSLMTPTVGYGNAFSAMNGVGVGNDATANINLNTTSSNQLAYAFKRAPSFMDVVAWTGNASNPREIKHNLTVPPELIIAKRRSGSAPWVVYHKNTGTSQNNLLNTAAYYSNIFYNNSDRVWGLTVPTSTGFYIADQINANSSTYVAYLFATCPGVSKVGYYIGTGTTQTVDCGFTAGARFVMIKRTDGTGGWYVWDATRGIVAANDPFLFLNSTAAETTNQDYIDADNSGFQISSTAPAEINASGASFIFLAVA